MPKYGGNKTSASGVFPKWVKRNRRRERQEEESEKVSYYNGQ